MSRTSLTLYDFSDRELLLAMLDHGDAEGWVSVYDLAGELGIEAKRPGQHVGVRMGWMRRYGATERKNGKPEWRPTEVGKALALGRLTVGQARMLDDLPPDKLLILTRVLTRRYNAAGDTAAHLMRREWMRGHAERRGRN